jgi:F0F1-type ATP synthase membrane subunit b/b'
MVASIVILALGLVAAVIYIAKHLHGSHSSKEEHTSTLDDARTKAVKIIDDANNQAIDIVGKVTLSANVASESFRKDLSQASSAQMKKFEKLTSDFTVMYSQVLQDLKTKNIETFQNVSKDIELNTIEEIKNFKESIKRLTVSSQKEVKEKIDTEYEASKKEIDIYKKEELKKVDSDIYDLLEKIAKEVLGKAISLSDHEALIEDALEKAKKEGVFKS